MLSKLFLIIFTFASTNVLYSMSRIYTPDVAAVFESKLIVTCSVQPIGENRYYYAYIDEILKNKTGEKIIRGKRLKISMSAFGNFGHPSLKYKKKYILYLNKYKDRWHHFSGEQHIKPLKQSQIPFKVADSVFWLGPTSYRLMVKEIQSSFIKESTCIYNMRVDAKSYSQKPYHSPVVLYFYNWHTRACYPHVVSDIELEPELTEPPEQIVDEVFSFCEEMPRFYKGNEALPEYIREHLPDSVLNNEAGIQTRTYARFIVEKDSTISEIKIVKSYVPQFDQAVIDLIRSVPYWIPGKQRGRPVRCYFTIPVLIKPTDGN